MSRKDKRKESPSKDVDTETTDNGDGEEEEFVVERVVDRRVRNGKVKMNSFSWNFWYAYACNLTSQYAASFASFVIGRQSTLSEIKLEKKCYLRCGSSADRKIGVIRAKMGAFGFQWKHQRRLNSVCTSENPVESDCTNLVHFLLSRAACGSMHLWLN